MAETEVRIGLGGDGSLRGTLAIPQGASGLVLFAHGSASSRLSPRNKFVSGYLNRKGIGTMLFDLLTEEEGRIDDITGQLRFDIGLLSRRLSAATEWALSNNEAGKLGIGYFGSSTGAAAALISAAGMHAHVKAVVSRGGRPDLAAGSLPKVRCPTLLIVGGLDEEVIELNREAMQKLRCEKKLEVVDGATHLFEEAGKLEEVSRLASEWFTRYL